MKSARTLILHLGSVLRAILHGGYGFFLPRLGNYDAVWSVFRPFGTKRLRLAELRARSFSGELLRLEETPHFFYARSILLGRRPPRDWETYIFEQYHCGALEMRTRRERFEALIEVASSGQAKFEILVAKEGDCYRIVDGFHRAAILAAQGESDKIKCALLFENKRNPR